MHVDVQQEGDQITIANLVISIGASAAGVRVELERANGYLRQFAQSAQTSFRTINRGLKAGAITGGRDAADVLMQNLTQTFSSGLGNVREQLFRGIITREGAAKHSRQASAGFNAGLLAGIEELRGRGLMSPQLLTELQGQLKDAGLKSGADFKTALSSQLQTLGNEMAGIGKAMVIGITAPLIAAGAGIAHFAGEAEVAAGRMKITFGPAADDMVRRLNEIHAVIPATRIELQNFAAIMAELLLPLGIAPKMVQDMSIGFIRLSKDLSIINNVSPERAMHALQSSLIGLTRPLKLLGVDITESSIKMKAQELSAKGLMKTFHNGRGVLNERQRAEAAYAVVMERSVFVQQAAVRLNETYAVQLRFVKRDAIEAAVALGKQLIPAIIPLIKATTSALKAFAQLDANVLKNIVTFGIVLAALGPLLFIFGKMTAAIGVLMQAFIAFRMFGLAPLLLTFKTNIIALGLLAIAGGIAYLTLKALESRKALNEFRQGLVNLTKDQLAEKQRAVNETLMRLAARKAELEQQPLKVNKTIGATGNTVSVPTEAGKELARVTKNIQALTNQTRELGAQFVEVTNKEKLATDELEAYLKHLKEFGEKEWLKPTQRAIEVLRDAVSSVIDRLEVFRELGLETNEPLRVTKELYDKIVGAVGGIANIHRLDADHLQQVLRLVKAIKNEEEARAKGPRVAAREALDQLIGLQQSAIQDAELPIDAIVQAYEEVLAQVHNLEEIIRIAGDKAAPEDIAALAQIRRRLGSIARTLISEDERLSITLSRHDRGGNAVQVGIDNFYQSITDLMRSNTERFSALRAGFGAGPAGIGAIATGGLEQLKAAALGVVEGFTPLALIIRFIGKAFEPLAPIIEALLLPLDMVAQVLATALIPVLKLFWPVIKYTAVAVSIFGEGVARVTAAIWRGIGNLLIGIGKFINWMLPGNPANGLVKLGKGMLKVSDEINASAREMARTRREILDMSFDDARIAVEGLAEAARDASQNIPNIYKLASAIFKATSPYTLPAMAPPTTIGARPRPPDGAHTTSPVVQQHTYQIRVDARDRTAREMFGEIEAEAERQRLARTGQSI